MPVQVLAGGRKGVAFGTPDLELRLAQAVIRIETGKETDVARYAFEVTPNPLSELEAGLLKQLGSAT